MSDLLPSAECVLEALMALMLMRFGHKSCACNPLHVQSGGLPPMSNDNSTDDLQRSSFANNYASRLLNRVLSDRKKADSKLTVADAAKFANQNEAQELVPSN
jgi:hypothetical protein